MIRSTLALLLASTAAVAADPPRSADLDPKTVAAYEKLGAEYGHMYVSDLGYLRFQSATSKSKLPPDAVPAFLFRKVPAGPLPPVEGSFGLDFTRAPMTDADLEQVAKVEGVTALGLANTRVSDAGLAHAARFGKLATLDLTRTAVTDEGLTHLARLDALTTLLLDGTNVTDKGVIEAARFKSLKLLEPGKKKVTDDVLAALVEAGRLHVLAQARALKGRAGADKGINHLNLSGTPVTDRGMEHVAKLGALNGLHLADTAVTDKGAEHIATIPTLITLDLARTAITDAGLEHLVKLSKLYTLDLTNTKTTSPAVVKFKMTLRKCIVLR
jgi:hypothetical protein